MREHLKCESGTDSPTELQFALGMQPSEPTAERVAKLSSQLPLVAGLQRRVLVDGDPAFSIERNSTDRNQYMQVRVMSEALVPGVQNDQGACFDPDPLQGIFSVPARRSASISCK